jgi:hypothetical protein
MIVESGLDSVFFSRNCKPLCRKLKKLTVSNKRWVFCSSLNQPSSPTFWIVCSALAISVTKSLFILHIGTWLHGAELCTCLLTSLTRLGEFSPIGQLISLGIFMKIIKRVEFPVRFFHRKKFMHKFWQKNGLGYSLGDFFASSPGHPARNASVFAFSLKKTWWSLMANRKKWLKQTFLPERGRGPGLPDFSWCNIPKRGRGIHQNTPKLRNGHNVYQMAVYI